MTHLRRSLPCISGAGLSLSFNRRRLRGDLCPAGRQQKATRRWPCADQEGERRSAQQPGLLRMRRQFDLGRWLPALLAVLDHHVGIDAAAHVPLGRDAQKARVDGLDHVREDVVGHLLVEGALAAVAPHVHLQALELDALLVGDAVDREVREIGLAGQRAEAGELGDLELDDEMCTVMDYFEIFLTRMLLCRRAAEFLGLKFKLLINDITLL